MWKFGFKRAILVVLVLATLVGIVGIAFAEDLEPDPETGDPGLPADKKGFQKIITLAQKVLNFLMAAGGIWVVGSLALNGWRLASPSPRTRMEGMEGLKFALIGAFITFGAYVIATWLRGLVVGL
ncbi:MAG: hypothetical protein NUW23_08755 [Firmicutes bacterium]|nr:hypothetical protein [Bacillota bacterium]